MTASVWQKADVTGLMLPPLGPSAHRDYGPGLPTDRREMGASSLCPQDSTAPTREMTFNTTMPQSLFPTTCVDFQDDQEQMEVLTHPNSYSECATLISPALSPGFRSHKVPGTRCPTCALAGKEVWVIPGRACGYCGTPCVD
ncbi:unnamed protein product [Fusarium equiseti]|uniref:Uncharacterized protein n=1 Tax=Fusarium equiseti TaxID=61235 RepID=A0A8J2J3N9_FUSEQ|nr:unnamed protein product [Fusarium equiseti]